MVWQFGTLTALAGNPASVSSTHRVFYKRPDSVFLTTQVPAHMVHINSCGRISTHENNQ